MKVVKKGIFSIITIILVILFVINIYSFVSIKIMKKDIATVFGYSTLEVVSGSMEPTIHIGDMILVNTKKTDYQVGDIVTFYDRQGSFVTHRIVSIENDKVITKGDNNNSIDDAISIDKIVGKCVKIIANGGKILNAFKSPLTIGMIFVTGILACVYLSLDKNGKPILTEEEMELEMFKKNNKKMETIDENDLEFNEFDEELDLDLENEYDELEGTESDGFEDYYEEEEEFEDDYEYVEDESEEEYYEEEDEESKQIEKLVKKVEEKEVMADIVNLEAFRKYKEEKELAEFRKYKEEKELAEFKQYEAEMKKQITTKKVTTGNKTQYHKNPNGYKKYDSRDKRQK